MRLLRAPLLHFLLIGLLLWCGHQLWQQRQAMQVRYPEQIRIEQLIKDWRQAQGRLPTEAERAALIQAELDRRILVAEAFRRNWHRHDPVVIRRLLADARFMKLEGTSSEQIEEAIALGLHAGDPVIVRRLEERMRASVHPPPGGDDPTPHWERRAAAEHALITALRARYRIIQP